MRFGFCVFFFSLLAVNKAAAINPSLHVGCFAALSNEAQGPVPPTVLIMAAGFGTRLGELTKNNPKPNLRAGGLSGLQFASAEAEAIGAKNIYVNGHYLAGKIETAVEGQAKIYPEVK